MFQVQSEFSLKQLHFPMHSKNTLKLQFEVRINFNFNSLIALTQVCIFFAKHELSQATQSKVFQSTWICSLAATRSNFSKCQLLPSRQKTVKLRSSCHFSPHK